MTVGIDDLSTDATSIPRAWRSPGVVWRSLRLWQVRAGLAMVAVVAGISLLGPAFAPHGETEFVGRPNTRNVEGLVFGTDYLGQDVLSRFLLGGWPIVLSAVLATGLGVVIGAALGLVAALTPGRLDQVVMRSIDVVLAVPQFLLVLVAMTTIGPRPWLIVVAVALTTAPRVARVTRGAAVTVVERDFVAVSRALGESRWHIARADVVPNVSGPLLVEANIRLTYAIGIVASLAFLGFTPNVNAANWGLMVQENRAALATQPWGVVLPTCAIALLAIGTGLVADGVARTIAGIDRAS